MLHCIFFPPPPLLCVDYQSATAQEVTRKKSVWVKVWRHLAQRAARLVPLDVKTSRRVHKASAERHAVVHHHHRGGPSLVGGTRGARRWDDSDQTLYGQTRRGGKTSSAIICRRTWFLKASSTPSSLTKKKKTNNPVQNFEFNVMSSASEIENLQVCLTVLFVSENIVANASSQWLVKSKFGRHD